MGRIGITIKAGGCITSHSTGPRDARPVNSGVIQNMKLFLNLLFLAFFACPTALMAQQHVEIDMERINPFVFGKNSWDDPGIIVADLKGKYLGKVFLSDIQGKVNLRIAVCNDNDAKAKLEVSAAIFENRSDLVWSVERSKYEFPSNTCPAVIGFNLFNGNDHYNYLKTTDLKFPIRLVLEFSEDE